MQSTSITFLAHSFSLVIANPATIEGMGISTINTIKTICRIAGTFINLKSSYQIQFSVIPICSTTAQIIPIAPNAINAAPINR